MTFLKTFGLLLLAFSLFSCRNNNICFNERNSEVFSCDGYPLRKIRVTDKTENITYYFSLSNGSKSFEKFDLKGDHKRYVISNIYNNNIGDFQFLEGRVYIISNLSEVDATPNTITIQLNNNGRFELLK